MLVLSVLGRRGWGEMTVGSGAVGTGGEEEARDIDK